MATLYPLTLTPLYKQYIWGGRRFQSALHRPLPDEEVYAESWEVSDHGSEQSVVRAGPLAGTSLHQLVSQRGEELLGRHHPQQRFPLLLKYLDANKPLSVQVHPDDALAARMGLSDPGKSEAWYVLQVEPGSRIWAGFNRRVDRETLARAINDGRLEQYLHCFEPSPGECLFLPAGTVHALGSGLLVAEIQQTSDNTFRLYDWNRLGSDGKPRPLHIEEGLTAINYRQGPVSPRPPQDTDRHHIKRLVSCDKFILDRWEFSSPQTAGGDRQCHILTVLAGEVEVEGTRDTGPLGVGQTALVPAAVGGIELAPRGREPVVLLEAHLP